MELVHIVVFTSHLVIVARTDPKADGVPTAEAVRRRSLVSMKLSASERIDAHERRSYNWPGTLNLVSEEILSGMQDEVFGDRIGVG